MRALRSKLRTKAIEFSATDGPRRDSRYANLIIQLKDLENLNRIHAHYVDWLRMAQNWSNVRLPTLFSEIFDIPVSSKGSGSSSSSAIGSQADDCSSAASSVSGELEQDLIGEDQQLAETEAKTLSARQISTMNNLTTIDNDEHGDDREDFFFSLSRFQDTDDKIDASDLNPTVDCLDSLIDQQH